MIHYPQSHYVAGWLIIVTAHNWPAGVTFCLAVWCAVLLWRTPTRRRAALLYGSALLFACYEYAKHVGPTLRDAVNYLLIFELAAANRPAGLLVDPIITIALLTAALWFLGYGLLASTSADSSL